MTGPLAGVRIIEIAGQGPGPFACMLLADLGADIIRVDRPGGGVGGGAHDRGRPTARIDLKSAEGVAVLLDLVESRDALVEGFRPGVMERLGAGPDACLSRNPRLVYGRMTGWGQDGPLSQVPGHDINYLALSGALHAIGPADGAPTPPLNLVADYGGGGMLLALGVVSALYEAKSSGQGQVVDAAMVDGVASMLAPFLAMSGQGHWSSDRGTNILDGGAPFYGVYGTSDGRWVSVGAMERQFYRTLLRVLGLDDVDPEAQMDRASWPALRERFARIFSSRTRDEWSEMFAGEAACFQPVLAMSEAPDHPHAQARGLYLDVDGVSYPAPAPRFSRTPLPTPTQHTVPVVDTRGILAGIGRSDDEIDQLISRGTVV